MDDYGVPVNTTHTITKFDDFWDHDGNVNEYGFLSNFYNCGSVTIDLPWTGPMTAPTTEHLYAAAKTWSRDHREQILAAYGPGHAKSLGRQVDLVDDWEIVKWRVMRVCIEAKFPAGSDLAQRLLDTFPMHLREGTSWSDEEWGVDILRDGQPGHNLLGMILMDHRSRLMDGLPPIGYIG